MRLLIVIGILFLSIFSSAQSDSIQEIDLLYYYNNQSVELEYNSALDLAKEMQFDMALVKINKALVERPDWDDAFQLSLKCASNLEEKKLYQQLQKTYDLELNDQSYYLAALYAMKSGFFTNSKTFFDAAIEINPNNPEYYRSYASLLEQMGHISACAEQFNIAMAIDPDDAYYYLDRANMFLRNDLMEASYQDLKKAYSMKPKDDAILYALASIHYKRKEYNKSLDYLKSILSPRFSQEKDNLLALIEMQNANYEEALNLMTSHLLGSDAKIFILNNAGNYSAMLDMFYQAESYYSKAIVKGSADKTIYRNRGVAYELLREMDKACDDWSKASSMGDELSERYLKERCK